MGRIWALALIVTALACADAQARVPIGLADQHPAALRDERVTWLGITNVRVVAPWNAALEPSAELDEWLRTARDRGFDALVCSGGGEDCRGPRPRCARRSPRSALAGRG